MIGLRYEHTFLHGDTCILRYCAKCGFSVSLFLAGGLTFKVVGGNLVVGGVVGSVLCVSVIHVVVVVVVVCAVVYIVVV